MLEADEARTLLRVRHSGLPDAIDADILQGWKDYLPRLEPPLNSPAARKTVLRSDRSAGDPSPDTTPTVDAIRASPTVPAKLALGTRGER